MAEKIDYKKYLEQFGKIETDAKNRLKAYFEEQIKQDAALAALYRPEKIDDCYNFIKDAVKASGCGSSAAVEDTIVFKMARDFYLDILPKQTDEPAPVKSAGAETAADAETEAETELETETEETPADNENEGTPCEEAELENEKPAEVMLHQADDEGEESGDSENSEAETEQAEEEKPADNENEAVTDEYGFEVFGEEKATEASAETAASAETKAEPENEKPEPFHPKYDEDGNGLLFDI